MLKNCLLCQTPCLEDSPHAGYCCFGCQTVHSVLEAKGVKNFQQDVLFLQAKQSGLLLGAQLQPVSRETDQGIRQLWRLDGMWCSSCAQAISWLLEKVPGVLFARVDYACDLLTLRYDPKKIGPKEIQNLVQSWGYTLHDLLQEPRRELSRYFTWQVGVSLFLLANLMMLTYPAYLTYLGWNCQGYEYLCSLLSAIIGVPLVAWTLQPVVRSVKLNLRAKTLRMESLILIGAISSCVLSLWRLAKGDPHVYFDTAGVLLVFLQLGHGMEKKIKYQAQSELIESARFFDAKVRQSSPHGWSWKNAKEFQLGDPFCLLAHDQIRLDGEITSGVIWVDESWMHGEPRPIRKVMGDKVIAGSYVCSGFAHVKTLQSSHKSELKLWLDRLAKSLEERRVYLPWYERWIGLFTWFVLALASAVFLILAIDGDYLKASERVLSVLLISCPCSLGIAVPIVRSRQVAKLSKEGTLVRSVEALEKLAHVNYWVFDKTGTLTQGRFECIHGIPEDPRLRQLLKGTCLLSPHPICVSLQKALEHVSWSGQVDDFEEIPSCGICATIDGQRLILGKPSWVYQHIKNKDSIEFSSLPHYFSQVPDFSVCDFVINGYFVARMILGDPLQEQAISITKQLPGKCILLSGDRQEVCEKVAKACSIGEVIAGASVWDKQQKIIEIRSRDDCQGCAMIGDGINDTLAMQQCDVSIALAWSKVDATSAMQWADIALVENNSQKGLLSILSIYNLSRQASRVIKQNILWSFFYNLAVLPLAALGLMAPIHAALAMIASSFSVVLNSKRI